MFRAHAHDHTTTQRVHRLPPARQDRTAGENRPCQTTTNGWGQSTAGGSRARNVLLGREKPRRPRAAPPPPTQKPGAQAGGMITTYEAKGRVAESHLSGQGQGAGGRWWRVLPDSARSPLYLGWISARSGTGTSRASARRGIRGSWSLCSRRRRSGQTSRGKRAAAARARLRAAPQSWRYGRLWEIEWGFA